ncbi:hypothetical protein JTE90_015284 [Oedothorax gibbosus]|uniref:MARVEL domain-containing protein n=1 Tax=Oedothorax gibbosus TaxID=931172 RepID=A0AAV6UBB7_9ARAC|nr:hypothetical protein JTE90_015284 [Oedothorax gibbosus]
MQVSPETSAKAGSAEADKSSSKKNSSKTADLEGGEEQEESVRSVTRRLLRWTAEDLFDWNPGYARTARGILTLLHIVLSAMVITMVGTGCSSGAFIYSAVSASFNSDNSASYFYCHSSAAFMFVVASSAIIQSTLLMACCLLSKKGDVIIHSAALELVYYIVFGLLFLFAGLALGSNLRTKQEGYSSLLAGGVFGLTNSILYFISAVWSFMYFKKHFGEQDGK